MTTYSFTSPVNSGVRMSGKKLSWSGAIFLSSAAFPITAEIQLVCPLITCELYSL